MSTRLARGNKVRHERSNDDNDDADVHPLVPHVHARHPQSSQQTRLRLVLAVLAIVGCVSVFGRESGRLAAGGAGDSGRDDIQLAHGVGLRGNDDGAGRDEPQGEKEEIRADVRDTKTEITSSTPSPSTPLPSSTTPESTAADAPAIKEETLAPSVTTSALQDEALQPLTDTPIPASPTVQSEEKDKWRELCYSERDFGLIERAAIPSKVLCKREDGTAPSADRRTEVTLIDAPASLSSAVFHDLTLDLTTVRIYRPIKSLAQDGGTHDPRFVFNTNLIHCSCSEMAEYATNYTKEHSHPLNVWDPLLVFASRPDTLHPSLLCSGTNPPVIPSSNGEEPLEISDKVVLMGRRDDHNPFFQVSHALNTWTLLQALRWDPKDVTLVHLDAGYPSPIDELHTKMLAPERGIVDAGKTLKGKRVRFSGDVLLAPFETNGPMMQHLDDFEPCFGSELVHTFRFEALRTINVTMPEKTLTQLSSVVRIVVTIITRRPYSGRTVQRRWRNEDEVVQRMKEEYGNLGVNADIVFQSVEFVNLSLKEQIETMLESDIVIGMHGAGLVNVLWTEPKTMVVEIFPKNRKRWGYRNLCQFVGCDWHEFRGGQDIRTGPDSNANDKRIPYDEWHAFFDPIFRARVGELVNSNEVKRAPTMETRQQMTNPATETTNEVRSDEEEATERRSPLL